MNLSSPIRVNLFYEKYSTTWLVYAGTLYGLTPLSLVSILMNLVAYKILRRKIFHSSKIFTYLRYNVFNSLILSCLLLTRFIGTNYTLHDITNSYEVQIFACYFYLPFLSILYLNENFFDIYITIERISYLVPDNPLKRMVKIKRFWLYILLTSLIINIPNFFVSEPFFIDLKLNDDSIIRKYMLAPTSFATSDLGKICTYMVYFWRDIVTLLIKIILNVYVVLLVRKCFYKIKFKPAIYNVSGQVENSENCSKKNYYTKVERNLTFISITMCILSSFQNIFYIASYVMAAFKYDVNLVNVYFFSNCFVALKSSTHLIILYMFNSVFKDEIRKSLFYFCFR